MKTIKISVRDKIAVNMSNIPYTCGNSDFVINFDFDAEWDEFSVKTARFIKDDRTYQDQVFQGNECPVPVLYNTNKVRVGVFAGNLHTSTPAIVNANKGILCGNGSPEVPSEDVYAQIMKMLNNSDALPLELDTTLTVAGSAADAKAVGDALANVGKHTDEQIASAVESYLDKNPVQSGKTASAPFPPIMQTAPIGQLFEAPENYTAWCPGNLRYDKNIDKYVDVIIGSDTHVNGTRHLYVTYIDPVTFEAEVPVAAKYVDEDGVTEIIPTGADGMGATNFNILSDGRYAIIKDNGDGSSMFRFISSDNGVTWVKSEVVTGIPSTLYGCTVLSNGRWIGCDDTLNCYFYYSDDEGITWTAVKPETGGFYYEGEACILELKENVLMAVGRMSMSGVGYSASGDAEHALLSFSYDNGENWSKWVESASIDNMNAASCTGFVHDGIVEIFAASRWFSCSSHAVTDYTNTGKSGAITHYVATVENSLNDKFTNRGIVVYANGAKGSDTDLPAQDFHAPCLAANGIGTDFLLVYFDRWAEPYTSESANHHFVHGSLYGFAPQEDADGRTGRTYSTNKIESLIAAAVKKLNIRIDEFIANGGSGETSDSFYVTDGLAYHIDAVSDDAISNQVLADKIGGTECALTATSGYEVEFSKHGIIHAAISCTGAKGFLDNPQEFTIECCVYNRTEAAKYLGNIPYGTVSAYNFFGRSGYNAYCYLNSAGEAKTGNFSSVTFSAAKNQLNHLLFAYSADGIKGYLNGIFMGEISTADLDDFASWNNYFSGNNQRVITFNGSDTHYFRSFRVYGKTLTAEEAAQNYNYEKYRLESVN